jgi:hypothetical protein
MGLRTYVEHWSAVDKLPAHIVATRADESSGSPARPGTLTDAGPFAGNLD